MRRGRPGARRGRIRAYPDVIGSGGPKPGGAWYAASGAGDVCSAGPDPGGTGRAADSPASSSARASDAASGIPAAAAPYGRRPVVGVQRARPSPAGRAARGRRHRLQQAARRLRVRAVLRRLGHQLPQDRAQGTGLAGVRKRFGDDRGERGPGRRTAEGRGALDRRVQRGTQGPDVGGGAGVVALGPLGCQVVQGAHEFAAAGEVRGGAVARILHRGDAEVGQDDPARRSPAGCCRASRHGAGRRRGGRRRARPSPGRRSRRPRAGPGCRARCRTSSRERPSTSSMTIRGRPSTSATSCTATTPGWRIRAAARASRCIRSRRAASSGAAASVNVRSSLTATSRPSTSSTARQTTPMPPRPEPAHDPVAAGQQTAGLGRPVRRPLRRLLVRLSGRLPVFPRRHHCPVPVSHSYVRTDYGAGVTPGDHGLGCDLGATWMTPP